MASLTIRDIPDEVLARLRERAAANRRSLNSEILLLLEREVGGATAPPGAFYQRIRERRAEWHGEGFRVPDPETLRKWIEEGRE